MDVSPGQHGFLEPEIARSDLLQPRSRALHSPVHNSQDKADLERPDQNPDGREDSDGACRGPVAFAPAWSDVVHDVEKPISRRRPEALAFASDVSSPPLRRRELGSEPGWLSGSRRHGSSRGPGA